MAMFHGVPKFGLAALALSLAGLSCATGDDAPDYIATTQDGTLRAYVSANLVRSAFASFCDEAADDVCDEFDKYDVEVIFEQDRPVTFTFVPARSTLEGPRSHSLICEVLNEGFSCGSTRQPVH
jgi:hypothetical protein